MDPERFVHVVVHLDANRVNSRGQLEAVNRLEHWRNEGVILMQMSQTAQAEAAAGGSPRRASKAHAHIFTITGELVPSEAAEREAIERVLFPGGAANANEANDVDVVFNAFKYGALLVTADGGSKTQPGGILGNRAPLAALGIRVATDAEAVALIEQKIRERDERAVWRAQRDGRPVASWVGRD